MPDPNMTATVARYSIERVQRELAFAVSALDLSDPATCDWLACLLARHTKDLPASHPSAGSPLDALCAEVKDALEGECNDAEHDALVSVAQHLGLDWTSHEEKQERAEDRRPRSTRHT
jgi:hypothetical protein